jgi:hypothetical protein
MSKYGINTAAMEGIFAFVSRSKQGIHTCTKYALLEIGVRLQMYSAVGDPSLWSKESVRRALHKNYVPGLFINNWQLGVDQFPTGMLTNTPDASASTSTRSLTKIPRWPAYHDYYFVNNTPYAQKLELGYHSHQVPPGGMVGRVRLEFPQIIQEAIAKYHSGVGDVTGKNQVSSAYGD